VVGWVDLISSTATPIQDAEAGSTQAIRLNHLLRSAFTFVSVLTKVLIPENLRTRSRYQPVARQQALFLERSVRCFRPGQVGAAGQGAGVHDSTKVRTE
jgi:hypothetical protein